MRLPTLFLSFRPTTKSGWHAGTKNSAALTDESAQAFGENTVATVDLSPGMSKGFHFHHKIHRHMTKVKEQSLATKKTSGGGDLVKGVTSQAAIVARRTIPVGFQLLGVGRKAGNASGGALLMPVTWVGTYVLELGGELGRLSRGRWTNANTSHIFQVAGHQVSLVGVWKVGS